MPLHETTNWHKWSIEALFHAIDKDRVAQFGSALPSNAVANATSSILQFASAAGDLQFYSLVKLEAKGIETSIATAIVDFMNKRKSVEMPFDEKIQTLHSMITVSAPPDTVRIFL